MSSDLLLNLLQLKNQMKRMHASRQQDPNHYFYKLFSIKSEPRPEIKNCQKNYGKLKSTPLNSSVIRWNGLQLHRVYNHIRKNAPMIFFTYKTIDNYFNHFFYNIYDEEESFFRGYPKGIIYSWYKGNVFGEDMELKKLRKDHMICLFNNSASGIDEDMNDISEINELY